LKINYILKSKELYLRPVTSKDVDLVYPYMSNHEISKDMSWDAHKTKAQTLEYLKSVEDAFKKGRSITWAVFLNKKFTGVFSVIAILRKHRSLTYNRAEIAYWLGPEFQGKGIMTRAGEMVLNFAYNELGLDKIVVGHHIGNTGSEKLIKRLGFRFTYMEKNMFMKYGKWIDCDFYEMTKAEWNNRKSKVISFFVSPDKHEPLAEIGKKYLESQDGHRFPVVNDIPDLIYPYELSKHDSGVQKFYDARAEVYDKFLPLTFKTHFEDEKKLRKSFIQKLNIKKGSKVLEVACGTGRDSEIIAEMIGTKGELHLQDISYPMLDKCRSRLKKFGMKKTFSMSNACYLPYPDKYFDAVYSFGGLGEFEDIKMSLKEMVRVTKTGGKIVVGDESMPPWLRETEFYKILVTTNPQFAVELPIDKIPVEARKLNLTWVIGGVFYLIDFEAGDGEPKADFDFDIPGVRGGTYRTRYEGQLEGVSREAKSLAYKAIAKKKTSMYKWLDTIVKKQAKKDLKQ